jgi:GNAT superfamily N-acetyltransferase
MAIDDLVWTRTPEGIHYLGRITGDWRFQAEMSEADVVIIRPCDWQEVGPNDILPYLDRHLNTQATVQRIRNPPIGFEESRKLYSRLRGEDHLADEWDDVREEEIRIEEAKIRDAEELDETEREQLIKSRRGQGLFRQLVLENEPACRVTGVTDRRFLIASHIKPWRDATNAERLDGENGLLLSPNIDWLFDRGYISFEDDGDVLISPVVDQKILESLGGPNAGANIGEFTEGQRQYLSHHRRGVFLEAGRNS